MELGYERSESGSEMIVNYETTKLTVEDAMVVLVVETKMTDADSGSTNNSAEKYKIDPMELAELIKQHGERV